MLVRVWRLRFLCRLRHSGTNLLEQVAHNYPHPLRHCRQPIAQIVLNGLSMIWVFENGDKAFAQASVIGGKHVTQPMKRLHETHGGTASPVETTGRGGLEVESEVAECDGPQASISEDADARRNCVGEAEVVGGGETIDHDPNFALAGQRVEQVARVWICRLSGEPVGLGDVVEAANDPPKSAGSNQPMEGLIDRRAGSQVGEVLRSPDARVRGGDAVPDGGWNAECWSRHG